MFSNSSNDLTDCHRTKQKKSESECSELSLKSLGYLKKNSTTSSTDSSDLEQEDDGNSTSKIRSGSIVGSMDAISMQSYVERKLQLFSDSEGNEEDPTNAEDSSSGESDCASDNSQTRGFYTPSDEEPDDLFYLTIPGEPRTALMTPKRSAKNSTKMSGPDPEDKVYQMTSKETYDRHSFCIPGKGNIFPIELPIGSEAKPRHEPMFGPELAPLNVAAARKVIAATLRPIFALQEAEETRTQGTKIAKKARKAGVGAIEWMLGKGYSKDAVGHETTSASGDSELEWPLESTLSFKDKLSSLLKSITNMSHCKSSWQKNAFELEYTKQGSVHRHVMTEKEDFWEMWVRRHTESALVLNEILQNSPLLTLVLQLAIGDGRVGFIAHERTVVTGSLIELLLQLRHHHCFYVTHLRLDNYKFERPKSFYSFLRMCSTPDLKLLHCQPRRKLEFMAIAEFARTARNLTLVGKNGSIKSKKIKKYLMKAANEDSDEVGQDCMVTELKTSLPFVRTLQINDGNGKKVDQLLLEWASKCPGIRHTFSGGRPVRMMKISKQNLRFNIGELWLEGADFETFRMNSEYKRYSNLRHLHFADSFLCNQRALKMFKALLLKLKDQITGLTWVQQGGVPIQDLADVLGKYLGPSEKFTSLCLQMTTEICITGVIYVITLFHETLTKLTIIGPSNINFEFTEENIERFAKIFTFLEELTVRITDTGRAQNLNYFIHSLLMRSPRLKKLELHLSDHDMSEVIFYLPCYFLDRVETVIIKSYHSKDYDQTVEWITTIVRSIPRLKNLVILDNDAKLLRSLKSLPMMVHNVLVSAPRYDLEF